VKSEKRKVKNGKVKMKSKKCKVTK